MSEQISAHAGAAGTIDVGGDLTVNRLGFGAMRITGTGIWGDPPSRDDAKAVLRRAVELGVNFIDTADSYGPDVSEELIAEALHPYPDDLVIATKGGLERPGPEPVDRQRPARPPARGAATAACAGCGSSRSRCTSSTGPTRRCRCEESIGALVELKDAGQDPPHRRVQRHRGRSCGWRSGSPRSCRSRTGTTSTTATRSRWSTCASRSRSRSCRGRRSRTSTGNRRSSEIADAARRDRPQVVLAWLLARSPAMLPIPGTGSVAAPGGERRRGDIALSPARSRPSPRRRADPR